MPYDKIQFVGYCIKTGFASIPLDREDPKSKIQIKIDAEFQWYWGHQDEEKDYKARLACMQDAIDTAYNGVSIHSDTMKVFIAPEFYFQPGKGNYSNDAVKGIISELSGMVSDDKFADWVFVFGTIIGDPTGLPNAPDTSNGNVIHNIVYVLQGGSSGVSFYAYKQNVSGIDFIQRETPKKDYKSRIYRKAVEGVDLQAVTSQFVRSGDAALFTIGGVDFGLEVCLDHLKDIRFLRTHMINDTSVTRPHVHLLTSCGMSPNTPSVVSRVGGHFFHTDGISPYTCCGTVVGDYTRTDNAPMAYWAGTYQSNGLTLAYGGSHTLKHQDGDVFKIHQSAPRVDIYAPRDLPTTDGSWP